MRAHKISEALENAAPDLLEACKRALPWIGKMVADGGHLGSVAPQQCVNAMQMMTDAILKAEASHDNHD